MFGLSNSALEAIIQLFSFLLPKDHCVPDTLEKVQKVVHDLGLDYQKIHACINDCVLFPKEYADMDTCPTCQLYMFNALLIYFVTSTFLQKVSKQEL